MLSQLLPAAGLVVVVGLVLFLNWRSRSSSSQDKGHVSDSWLAANRAANRTTD